MALKIRYPDGREYGVATYADFQRVHEPKGAAVVGGEETPPAVVDLRAMLEAKTVKQLAALLDERGIEPPKKARKAELVDLILAAVDSARNDEG